MLDIKFIRDNKDLVAAGAKKKHIEINLDELVSIDDERKKIMQSIETKRANQKVMGDNMAKMQSGQDKAAKLEELKAVKEEIQKEEETLKGIVSKWQTLMIQVPNIPDISASRRSSISNRRAISSSWRNCLCLISRGGRRSPVFEVMSFAAPVRACLSRFGSTVGSFF